MPRSTEPTRGPELVVGTLALYLATGLAAAALSGGLLPLLPLALAGYACWCVASGLANRA